SKRLTLNTQRSTSNAERLEEKPEVGRGAGNQRSDVSESEARGQRQTLTRALPRRSPFRHSSQVVIPTRRPSGRVPARRIQRQTLTGAVAADESMSQQVNESLSFCSRVVDLHGLGF